MMNKKDDLQLTKPRLLNDLILAKRYHYEISNSITREKFIELLNKSEREYRELLRREKELENKLELSKRETKNQIEKVKEKSEQIAKLKERVASLSGILKRKRSFRERFIYLVKGKLI